MSNRVEANSYGGVDIILDDTVFSFEDGSAIHDQLGVLCDHIAEGDGKEDSVQPYPASGGGVSIILDNVAYCFQELDDAIESLSSICDECTKDTD